MAPKRPNSETGASSHKTNYIDIFSEILNCCIGSRVTAILLNGWILPTGGVGLGRVCPAACSAGMFLKNQASKMAICNAGLSKGHG